MLNHENYHKKEIKLDQNCAIISKEYLKLLEENLEDKINNISPIIKDLIFFIIEEYKNSNPSKTLSKLNFKNIEDSKIKAIECAIIWLKKNDINYYSCNKYGIGYLHEINKRINEVKTNVNT